MVNGWSSWRSPHTKTSVRSERDYVNDCTSNTKNLTRRATNAHVFIYFSFVQINELMATTPDELEQYQQIDRERLVTEAEMAREKGLRRWNRLMPADEAPAWLAPGAAAAAIAKAGGRGAAAAAAAAANEASGAG
ncbi:unnamed protein product, partial [Ectocarpus fasciculatus]